MLNLQYTTQNISSQTVSMLVYHINELLQKIAKYKSQKLLYENVSSF